jgi:hypothetical protein
MGLACGAAPSEGTGLDWRTGPETLGNEIGLEHDASIRVGRLYAPANSSRAEAQAGDSATPC